MGVVGVAKLLVARRRSFLVQRDAQEQPLEHKSDEDLARLVAEGDQDAFDIIYLRYRGRLHKFIKGFVEDDVTAQDLLQDCFLRFHQKAELYTATSKFSAWIYRVATNLCLNELRRRRAHPHISLNQRLQVAVTDTESETVELHELIPDTSFVGPSQAAESSETVRDIMSALSALSAGQRDVLALRLCDDLQYEQIAGILELSIGTVKSRTFYGLRSLRDKLGKTP